MISPSLGMDDVNYLFFIVMLFYGLVSYTLYMFIRRKDDYEYLFIALASVIAGTAGVIFHDESSTLVLSLSLVAWISMVAIIKLIKMDYYHDRNDILWFIRTITFVLFLIIGTLTCVNLYYNIKIQSLMLGFFLISVSILELFDPIADFLINKKIKSISSESKPIIIKENMAKELSDNNVAKDKVNKVKTKPYVSQNNKSTTKNKSSKSYATKPKPNKAKTNTKKSKPINKRQNYKNNKNSK